MLRQLLFNQIKTDSSLVLVLRRCNFSQYHNSSSFTSLSGSSRNMEANKNNLTGKEIDLLEINKDMRFNLPGNVGIFLNDSWTMKLKNIKSEHEKALQKTTKTVTSKVLLKNLSQDKPMPDANAFVEDERSILDCDAHECPLLLVKDFQELFPGNRANLSNGLTVLTLSFKSKADMSVWSREVNMEREDLMKQYFFTAERMCSFLKENGYWADFIDPSSGRPFYVSSLRKCPLESNFCFDSLQGDYTPATFFETDERYRNFGFEIEDLGCCKVISHQKWGTRAFVGALFTNAPLDSDSIQSLVIYMDK